MIMTQNINRLLAALLACGLLNACAAPRRPTAAAVSVEQQRQQKADQALREWLVLYQRYQGMSPAELTKEAARLGELKRSETVQVQQAMVWSLLRGPGDLARSVQQGDELLKRVDNASWRPLLQVLQAQWQQQRRQEDQVDRLNTQWKDEKKRADQLNEKLEGMKAIERSLAPKPTPTPEASR